MHSSQVIVHPASQPAIVDEILTKALQYALLSLPFTINRMALSNSYSRIQNIVKGKLAEGLLQDFGHQTGRSFDFRSGETPFWQRDLYDFRWDGKAYDIKNNFIHAGGELPMETYLDLPALVPNRHENDQWAQRLDHSHGSKAFLFTFISQGKDAKSGRLFNLSIASNTIGFLERWCKQFSDVNPLREPYTSELFWTELDRVGPRPRIVAQTHPVLVITGEARMSEFDRFEDTDSRGSWGYAMYKEHWYSVRDQGGLSFSGGLIQTRIRNATCPVRALPAFRI